MTGQRRCCGWQAYRQVFITVNTRQFFDQIRLDGHIKAVAWRNHIPAVFGGCDLHTQTLENIFNFAVIEFDTQYQFSTGTAQMNLCLLRQVLVSGDFHHRAGLTTADVQHQRCGAFHSFGGQVVIHTTLKAVRGICVQAIAARAAGNGQRAEERGFQQQILSAFRYSGMFAPHDATDGQWFFMVGNHQGIAVQGHFLTIKQCELFALLCHTYADAAFYLSQIECMHGLAQFKQYVVSNINHRINRADTATTQFFHHPQRCGGFYIHAFNDTAHITRALFRSCDFNIGFVVDGWRHWFDFQFGQIGFVQYADFTRQTGHAQAVCAVGRQIHFDDGIVEVHVLAEVFAHRRIRW